MICWEENDGKRWEIIKSTNVNTFLLKLLKNKGIRKHSIFVIPLNGFVSGIWLWTKAHRSNRVDFLNFFEGYGTEYKKPEPEETDRRVLSEIQDRSSDNTKYGWISPDGEYFHCCYQGHVDLAYDICFGMVDTNNAEQYLEEHGWLKIYKASFEKKV